MKVLGRRLAWPVAVMAVALLLGPVGDALAKGGSFGGGGSRGGGSFGGGSRGGGASRPSSGGSFGGGASRPSSGGSFGGGAAKPSSGGSFGSSSKPATGGAAKPATGGSFGSSSKPATGGSFGSSNRSAPSGSFGSSKPGTTSSSSSFGRSGAFGSSGRVRSTSVRPYGSYTPTRSTTIMYGGMSYPAYHYGFWSGYSLGWAMSPPWYYYTPFHPAFYFSRPMYYDGGVYPGGVSFTGILMGVVFFIFFFWLLGRLFGGSGRVRYTTYD